MALYILKRLLLFIPTLLGITLITFILMQSLPGDPVLGMAGERANPETIARIRAELGQDRPLPLQYLGYLRLLATGELGRSYYTNRKISEDLLQKFPNTARLALAAMLFASVIGIGMGVFAASKRGTNWDRVVTLLSVGGISIPVFWLGLALMLLFAFYLQWLPPSGMGNGSLINLILPAITLGTFSLSYIVRVTRSTMLETLSQPYVAAARAKGLSESNVVFKHALKNCAHPRGNAHRPGPWFVFERRGTDRNDLRMGRPRPLRARRDPKKGLPRHHGGCALRRSDLRGHEPSGRYLIPFPGSAGTGENG